MIEGEDNFPYQLIDVSVEKGDGKDEETATAIFKRVYDGKQFTLSVHDPWHLVQVVILKNCKNKPIVMIGLFLFCIFAVWKK